VVVLAGTVAADPVTRQMPSGDEVVQKRVSLEFSDVSDDLRAALAALTPGGRDLFRQALVPAERGSTSWISGSDTEDGDPLLDDLTYAINRGILDSTERQSLVQILNEIDQESG
jgi:hypothetical protein